MTRIGNWTTGTFVNLEEICLPIKSELSHVETVLYQKIQSPVPFVTDVAEYITKNGGKRLRPIYCLLASRLAGATGENRIQCAAAMEFFHTATLMHDDVIDNSEMRRGKASANSRWGNQVAVLVGDFFYCRASDLIVRTGNLPIIRLITDVMRITTEGEILEIDKSNDMNIREEDYLKIVEQKTAVLIGASCEMGGILGNISEEFIHALRQYGVYSGIAFQLADDVLDYVSDPQKFGKMRGADLKEGRLTLPLIHALRAASDPEKRLIKDALIAKRLEEGRLREIVGIIEKYNGLSTAKTLAHSYTQKAKDELAIFKPSIERDALSAVADYIIDRQQ